MVHKILHPHRVVSLSVRVRAYLNALVQTLQGVDVQPFLAGLQTGDDFLALDGPWSDGQS